MSTMQTGFGRVIDQRIDGARMVGAIARRARIFFRAMNGMPPADQAEAVYWRKQAGAAAQRTRDDAFVDGASHMRW